MKFKILIQIFLFLTFDNFLFPVFSQEKPVVKTGIDILVETNFNLLRNLNILLLTNHAGRTNQGELTFDAFQKTNNCKLIGLLTPEHGFYTTVPAGQSVGNDKINNIPVYSLYGKNKQPVLNQLKNCNAIVIDIQDIGIRSYTYLSTVYKTMEAAADNDIPLYILDRPNPIGGLIIDGNMLETEWNSFVGIIPVPYIHGCTIGELAEMINEEGWLPVDKKGFPKKCNLIVIKMQHWERWMQWEDTGLEWFPTSPHIPTVNAARGAAVLGVFGELGIISIGIGTTLPFQYIGAPYINTKAVITQLATSKFPGLTLNPTKYRPFYGMYSGKDCHGFLLTFPANNLFTPYSTGIKLLATMNKIYPNLFSKHKISKNAKNMFCKVTGTNKIIQAFLDNKSTDEIMKLATEGLGEFLILRDKYLMYK
jgi:uncharacterized protein YbbC (DUF1343 family)